ncbi:hypothetical protein K3495_g2168 [Podosphaera aphanis]|nr:hypothetical protein K3495_g2168 [Podosphaera aphanis]
MESETLSKPKKISQGDYDVISNQIISALAQRESLVKSWSTSSHSILPRKTQAELDAEDAALFQIQPPRLGVGALIPPEFLVSQAEQTTKSLRAKLLISHSLRASKARAAEEKAASAKRGLQNDSSDEEQGRTSLGRKKKTKNNSNSIEGNLLAITDQSNDTEVHDTAYIAVENKSAGKSNPDLEISSPLDSDAKKRKKKREKKQRQKIKSAIADRVKSSVSISTDPSRT